MTKKSLSGDQKKWLQLMSLWVWDTIIELGEDTEILVLGEGKKISEYYSCLCDISFRGYYWDKLETDVLNELRVRFIYKSLDIHLALSLP